MTVITRSVSFRTPNSDTVLDNTSQNETESGENFDEQRNRYSVNARLAFIRNSAFHVTAASDINTIRHTVDENVANVNSSSWRVYKITTTWRDGQ